MSSSKFNYDKDNDHLVHPLCNQINKDEAYFKKPMTICCMVCGEKPLKNSQTPFPLICGREDQTLELLPVLCCSVACLYNAAKSFPYGAENCKTLATWFLRACHGFERKLGTLIPEVDSLPKFGGVSKNMTVETYQDPNVDWKEVVVNSFCYRPYDPNDSIWHEELKGKYCCRYCLQPIQGIPTTVAIRFDPNTKKVLATHYLFHENGSCALSWIIDECANSLMLQMIEWTKRLLSSGPWKINRQSIHRGHHKWMLDCFGGPLSLKQFLHTPSHLCYFVSYLGESDYPYKTFSNTSDPAANIVIYNKNITLNPLTDHVPPDVENITHSLSTLPNSFKGKVRLMVMYRFVSHHKPVPSEVEDYQNTCPLDLLSTDSLLSRLKSIE